MSKSIHSIENIAYVREELGASAWVIKTLTEGYSVPFSRLPGKSVEKRFLVFWNLDYIIYKYQIQDIHEKWL